MSDSTHKTSLRDSHGPRAVDGREKSRGDRRADDSSKSRSSRSGPSRSSKSESSHSRTSSSTSKDRPTFEVDIIGQTSRNIVLGSTVEASAMVSLKVPSPDMIENYRNLDTSRLMGVVSLIAESRSGERMPVECGTLTGQKMFDSVHPMPQHTLETLARNQPCRVFLGYICFPDLLIRQHGTYRLRVTLLKNGSAGSLTVCAVDSEPIKVDRRNPGSSGTPRKHQRS